MHPWIQPPDSPIPDEESPYLRAVKAKIAENWRKLEEAFEPEPPTLEAFDAKLDEAIARKQGNVDEATQLLLGWGTQSDSIAALLSLFQTFTLTEYAHARIKQQTKKRK